MHYSIICFPANSCSALATMGIDHTFHYPAHSNPPTQWFIGASMGAIRSLAILQSNITQENYTNRLAHFLSHLTYQLGDTPATLTHYLTSFYDTLLPDASLPALLTHPSLHVGIMVTRLRSPFNKLPTLAIVILLILYLILGIFTPIDLTTSLFEQLCYYSGPSPPPIKGPNYFYPLTEKNIKAVVQATSAVPFISHPVTFIDQSGPGYFLDGGINHYTCNFEAHPDHLCLIVTDQHKIPTFKHNSYPHFIDRVTFCPKHKKPPSSNNHYYSPHPTIPIPTLTEWFYPAYIRTPSLRIHKWQQSYQASLDQATTKPSPA